MTRQDIKAAEEYYSERICPFCQTNVTPTMKNTNHISFGGTCTNTNCGTEYLAMFGMRRFKLGEYKFVIDLTDEIYTSIMGTDKLIPYPLILTKDNYLQQVKRMEELSPFS